MFKYGDTVKVIALDSGWPHTGWPVSSDQVYYVILGRTGIVTESHDSFCFISVEIDGKRWSGRFKNDELELVFDKIAFVME